MALVRGNTSIRATGSEPGPLTLSHTVGAGSGRILFVPVTIEDASNSINTPTFNGVSLSEVVGSEAVNGANKVKWFYLLDPAVTTANISVSSSGGTGGMCCAGINYTGWPAGAVPVVAATTTASSQTSVSSGTITKLAAEFFLAAVSQGDAALTNTWTNATEFGDSQGNSLTFSVAYYEGTSTSLAISTLASSSTSRHALSVIKLIESTSIAVAVDDDTPSPTQAIVITKSGGDFAGTVVAELHDADENFVDVSAFLTGTGATRTLTLGGGSRDNYDDANATWELIPWGEVLTLRVTDSGGSGTDTLTIIPPVEDHFGVRGATVDYEVAGSANTDQIYVDVYGDGEGLPEISSFQGNTVPTTVRFRAFRRASNPKKWLAYREEIFDVASTTLDGGYADSFTGTDGTLITAHTPDNDIVGGGYSIEKDRASSPAVSNAVTIQGGRLYINDANEGMVIDVGTNEPDFSWDFICETGKEFVAQVRRLDDTEHIHLYVKQSTGLIRINERVADANIGVTGTNEVTTTFTNGVTYWFRIEVVDLVITVYVDDVQVLQVTSIRAGENHATKIGLFSAGAGTFPVQFDDTNVVTDYIVGNPHIVGDLVHKPDAPPSRNDLRWASHLGSGHWFKSLTTVNSRAVSYVIDGKTVWFDTLVELASSGGHYIEQRTIRGNTGQPRTLQALIVPNGRTDVFMTIYGNVTGNNLEVRFNLATGTVTSAADNGEAVLAGYAISEVAAGVFKIVVSGVAETTQATSFYSARIALVAGSTTYMGDGVSGAHIAQLKFEPGLIATPFNDTENAPLRSDQIIARAQRSHNAVAYPEDLTNAAWVGTGLTSVTDTLTFGIRNLNKIKESSGTSEHYVDQLGLNLNPALLTSMQLLATSAQSRDLLIKVYGDTTSNNFSYLIDMADGSVDLSSVLGSGSLHSISVVEAGTATVDGTPNTKVWAITLRGWPSTTSAATLNRIRLQLYNGAASYAGNGSDGIYAGVVHVVSGFDIPEYPGAGTAADPVFASPVSAVTVNGVSAPIAQDALILHTEDQTQTTPWSRTNIHAVTAEGVSADGYPAYKIDCNTTSGQHSLGVATFGKTLTDNSNVTLFSDIKADERSWFRMGVRTKADVYNEVFFNSADGTIGTVDTAVAYSIESRGSGWYRCRAVFSVTSGVTTPGMMIFVAEADNDVTFAGLGANDGLLVSRCFAVEGNVAMADADAAYVRAGSTMEYVRDRSSAIVTMPSMDQFDAAGSHVASGFNLNLPIKLTDGVTEIADTMQFAPFYAANFGVIGGGDLTYPPVDAQPGHDSYVQRVSGAGVAYPDTCNFAASEVSNVIFRAFNPAARMWLASRAETLGPGIQRLWAAMRYAA